MQYPTYANMQLVDVAKNEVKVWSAKDQFGITHKVFIYTSNKTYKWLKGWGQTGISGIDWIEVNGEFLQKRHFNIFFDSSGNPFTLI